jgi:hypothetical protein
MVTDLWSALILIWEVSIPCLKHCLSPETLLIFAFVLFILGAQCVQIHAWMGLKHYGMRTWVHGSYLVEIKHIITHFLKSLQL